jgi:serine kinase of HPr protein (carbohydrate metabolism regulator)
MPQLPVGSTESPSCNQHCCVIEIAGKGILIEGDAGTGKTSLALGLLEYAQRNGLNCALVSDDQAILRAENGVLKAQVPSAIAGMVEIRGFGIARTRIKNQTIINLVVRIIEDINIERMPPDRCTRIMDMELPLLEVPRRHECAAVRIVAAWLGNGQI